MINTWDNEILGSMVLMEPISTNEITNKVQKYHPNMSRNTLKTKVDFKLRLFKKYGLVDSPGKTASGRLWVRMR